MKQKTCILFAVIAGIFATMLSYTHAAESRRRMAKSPTVALVHGHTTDRKTTLLPYEAKTQKKANPNYRNRLRKVNASGSNILAFRVSPQPLGLVDVNFNGTEDLIWEGSEYWFPTTGFIYDGHIYGISAFYFYGTMYVSRMDYDIESGDITFASDMGENPAHAAITAAYDPALKAAYAFTYTEDIDGYMFNRFDPETFTYTPINMDVDSDDVCIAMTFDEKRDALIGITNDTRLVRIDTKSGTNTTLTKLPLDLAFYNTSMTYSPVDNAYVAQVIESSMESHIIKIDADTYEMEKTVSWNPDNIRQYMIMFSPDDIFRNVSPAAPILKEVEVNGAALSGYITFTMPTTANDGTKISQPLSFEVSIDGKPYLTKTEVKAGEDVKVSLNDMEEGLSVISARASAGDNIGKVLKFTKYFGYDTPMAPKEVKLNGKTATWSQVTEGENGGYVENVEYDVYLNDVFSGHTSETSMELDIPEDFSLNQVGVVAISHEKRSQRGYSRTEAGGMVALGSTLHPEEDEWTAFSVIDSDGDGCTWEFDDWYGISYQIDDEGEEGQKADDWVITPAFRIIDNSVRHRVSLTIDIESQPEMTVEVYAGSTPNPSEMKLIGVISLPYTAYGIQKELNLNTISEGPLYLAFHLLTTGRVHISDISVNSTEAKLTAADDVTDLNVIPADMGEEKASCSFLLPTTSIAGEKLTDDVTVTVKSDVDSVELTGKPGEKLSTVINVPAGMSRISLQTKEGDTVYSEEFFAGVDHPVAPEEIRSSVTEDNMEVTLSWDAPTAGIHNGWIDPSTIYYLIRVFSDEEGWIVLDEHAASTTYTHRLDEGAPQRAWYYSITPCNSQGESHDMAMTAIAMGTPYTLPMNDYMMMGGNLQPLMTSGEEGYGGSWTFSDPSYFEDGAEDVADFVVVGVNNTGVPTKGSMILPKFYPNAGERVSAYFRFFFGDKTPDIEFMAYVSDGSKTSIAKISAKDMPRGYRNVAVCLPESINGKTWTQIAIEPQYDGSNQALVFVSYSIFGSYAQDAAAISLDGPRTIVLGEKKAYSMTVRNDGYSPIAVPECIAEVSVNGKTVASASSNEGNEGNPAKELQPGEETRLSFSFNIEEPEALGAAAVTARIITADRNPANDEIAIQANIVAGDRPVVTDLTATETSEGNIILTWTQPVVEPMEEGFEDCEPFTTVDEIGSFINIDGDGEYTCGYCFPYHAQEYNPTGWVVWDWNEIEKAPYNNYYIPYSGDRMLVALSPDASVDADDWLISPAVAGDTDISFMMASCMTGVQEQLQIMVSETGNSISDFTVLDKIMQYTEDWVEYSYRLPEKAKYFALRYTSNNGSAVFIDDLAYTPVLATARYSGYDIYRDGMLIEENTAPDCSYEDNENNGKSNIYRVAPVYTLDTELQRGLLSNSASASATGIDSLEGKSVTLHVEDRYAVVRNGKGRTATIVSAEGLEIASFYLASDDERIELIQGVNIIKVDEQTWKLIK